MTGFGVHRVVHHAVNISLVRAIVRRIAVKDLAHRVHSGGLAVPFPEILFNMLDGIETKAIDYSLSIQGDKVNKVNKSTDSPV